MRNWMVAAWVTGALAGCAKSEPAAPAEAPAAAPAAAEGTGAAPAAEAPKAAEGTGAAPAEPGGAADTLDNGVYSSAKFNIRFRHPEGWKKIEFGKGPSDGSGAALPGITGPTKDSITFEGPPNSGIRMIVANTQSIQLAGNSFANLDERVGFDSVNIIPEKSQGRAFNGVPGYRTEGDAKERSANMPVYFLAQALELPGKPTMVTIFVPAANYFVHSDAMKAVLDSIEVLNLRQP